jgi:hypothetical protein
MSRILILFLSIDRNMKAVFHKRFAMLVRNQHCSAFRYAYDSRGDLAEGAVIKFDSHCFFRCSLLSLVCLYYTDIGWPVNPPATQFQNFIEVFCSLAGPPVLPPGGGVV